MDPNTPQPNQPYQPEPTPVTPPQPQQQPVQPQQNPQPQGYPQQPATVPGKTLGIVAFVLSLLGGGIVSLVLGIIAGKQSKKAGAKNGFALAAVIISAITFVVGLIIIIATIALFGYASTQLQAECQKLGPGTHTTNNATITCDENSKPVSGSVSGEATTNLDSTTTDTPR